MPRLSEATRQRRRDDIAAAAMRCFARDGFARTSMADIIREAGSSSGSVYSNFENKTDLVRYAAGGALRQLLGAASTEPSAASSPSTLLARLMRASADRAHAETLLQIWAEASRDPDLAEVTQRTTLELRTSIEVMLLPWCQANAVAPEVEADRLADAVLVALQGFIVRLAIDRDVAPEALVDRTIAVFSRAYDLTSSTRGNRTG